jgi:polyisoprenyl-teichoic acid--peptidoglycan teichoic acid transferase
MRQQLSKKSRMKKLWVRGAFVFCILVGGTFGILIWEFHRFITNIHSSSSSVLDNTSYQSKPLSIILLGKDSRGNYGGDLTDTMILMTLNPTTKNVTMLSIPRDTRVVIPGEQRVRKINSVLKRGDQLRQQQMEKGETPEVTGSSLLKNTLESIMEFK